MKNRFKFILIIIITLFCYYKFIYMNDIKRVVEKIENDSFNIESYSVFGTHLNISACINKNLEGNLNLILKNSKEEIIIDSNFENEKNKTCFYISDKNNEGIYLDELKKGKYVLLVKEGADTYYSFVNKNDYNNIEYYTLTNNNKNNKINIDFNKHKNKSYLSLKIKESKLPDDVYDITLDAGHGGLDTGCSYKLNGKTYYESNLTLNIVLQLKEKLENLGLKVNLTRDSDIYVDSYGTEGRAVIPNEFNSKYSLSLHLNSTDGIMYYGGVEVYVPNDINLEFASILANNISDIVNYSKKTTNKLLSGVYYTYFTENDIKESRQEMINDNMKPYDIKVGAPYMYMIREVGGISTFAYIDGRNEKYGLNKYYNSNQTAEPYLIELGYINYEDDLENLVNNSNSFALSISKAIEKYLNIS